MMTKDNNHNNRFSGWYSRRRRRRRWWCCAGVGVKVWQCLLSLLPSSLLLFESAVRDATEIEKLFIELESSSFWRNHESDQCCCGDGLGRILFSFSALMMRMYDCFVGCGGPRGDGCNHLMGGRIQCRCGTVNTIATEHLLSNGHYASEQHSSASHMDGHQRNLQQRRRRRRPVPNNALIAARYGGGGGCGSDCPFSWAKAILTELRVTAEESSIFLYRICSITAASLAWTLPLPYIAGTTARMTMNLP